MIYGEACYRIQDMYIAEPSIYHDHWPHYACSLPISRKRQAKMSIFPLKVWKVRIEKSQKFMNV